MTQKLLERKPAAAYVQSTWGIPCSPKWLAKLACVGTDGPPFYKAGRTPLYDTADLDAWAKKRLGAKRRSTSELAVTDSQKISVHDVRSVAKGGRNEA